MTVAIRPIEYSIGATTFDGACAVDDSGVGRRPAVLVFHGWEGRSDGQDRIAQNLAELGYVGFACDMFGKGIRGDLAGDNSALIAPFLNDRVLLRDRLVATVAEVRKLDIVDPQRIAAIGFCFGGVCVLDLARSGIDIRAVASFHGMFGRPPTLPIVPIKAKVIAFHGWDDPLAPPADVVALAKEMTEAGADWQLHAYGHTMHAFMAVGANRPERGIQYNERSAKRAWAALRHYLEESFAQ
jgi:dienelactone hydrolase